jgi:phosphatidylethanolamine/phosphatidyl-N-methylethanolamine N-methyltransferase
METGFFPASRLRRWVDRRLRLARLAFSARGRTSSSSQTPVESAYARWAPVYDWVFTAPLVPGQRAAAAEANLHEGELLEVGVGTGLSLPFYSRALRITGIDLSRPMLRRARERVARKRLDNVAGLRAMDATAMEFTDASFDVATVMYVVSVVPDPAEVMAEVERVVRPGGTVIIVNHFASERGVVAAAERFLARFAEKLGWDPLFPREKVLSNTSMTLEHESRHGPLGLFTMMVFKRPQ